MLATCVVCGKTFTSIGAVADHISETNKGIREDILEITDEQIEEIKKNEKEMEHFLDSTRGYAHVRFRDKNGVLLTEDQVTTLYGITMAGAHWCVDCGADFPNNFRLAQHCFSTGHGQGNRQMSQRNMGYFREFEMRWSL
jgi:hypothetical protein